MENPRIRHKSSTLETATSPATTSNNTLAQQYGGRHGGGWVNSLPKSFIPYIQLARLSPPVGVSLVLFPHVFGFLHALLLIRSSTPSPTSTTNQAFDTLASTISLRNSSTILRNDMAEKLIRPAALLIVGSFFLSNACHVWNDLVDAPYDAKVARTRERPIVRGAVSKIAATLFMITQAIAALASLALLIPHPYYGLDIILPSFAANLFYPMAKRYTNFAQYVLGFCLAWGVVVGTAGVLEALSPGRETGIWTTATITSTACLTAVCILWTVIYDTIYAFQDRKDDIKLGLKSTAVLFGEWTKAFLFVNLIILAVLLSYFAQVVGLGMVYHGIAIGGCVLSLGTMVAYVELEDAKSCWWWFKYGYWIAGGSIATGMALECIL